MTRRLLSLFLAALLVLGLTACNNKGEESSAPSDVTYFDGENTTTLTKEDISAQVSAGNLSISFEGSPEETVTATHTHGETVETTVTLGMESDRLVAAIEPSDYDPEQHRKVGENYIRYECGASLTAYFYYTNDDRKNGLASVVTFGTAYGFEPTVTTIDQVKAVMGTPDSQGPANDKALSMFLFYEPGYTYTDYRCGNNHITFFFHENGTLGVTAIYQDGLWIY